MPTVTPGRVTADLTEPVVVFLIGMRVNRWWKVGRWSQVARAMPKMMSALLSDPDLGLLHVENFSRGRTSLSVQYWRSHDHLDRFAKARDLPHAAPWARFMRELSGSGDVGIYHETYLVAPGSMESVYGDMPTFGLAAAVGAVPVTPGRNTGRQRLGRPVDPVS